MAGITQSLHPHLFRHQMLTFLTSKGLSDAQISADLRAREQEELGGLPAPVIGIGR
jgi:hypothetical protein